MTSHRARSILPVLFVVAGAVLAMACEEIPQDAVKPFATGEEIRSRAGSLQERAAVQDEYPRTGGAAAQ